MKPTPSTFPRSESTTLRTRESETLFYPYVLQLKPRIRCNPFSLPTVIASEAKQFPCLHNLSSSINVLTAKEIASSLTLLAKTVKEKRNS